MPNYDFKCESCQYTFERQLLIADRDRPLTEPCPSCACTEGTVERFLPSSNGLAYTLEKIRVPDTFSDLMKKIAKNNYGKVNDGKHFNT